MVVARGELWWGESPDEKGRPFLVVSRDAANRVMQRVLVAPVTSRIRGAPSELAVGPPEGLPRPSVATFDNLQPFPKAMLVHRLGALGPDRKGDICRTAAITLDC
ncbi:MAG: type II toxin-antitoxin system PemK/MazF family toxin [Acidimicrobiales bacterium]